MDQRHTQITHTQNTGDGKRWFGNLDFPFHSLMSKSLAGASLAYTPDKDPTLISVSQPLKTRALEIKWA